MDIREEVRGKDTRYWVDCTAILKEIMGEDVVEKAELLIYQCFSAVSSTHRANVDAAVDKLKASYDRYKNLNVDGNTLFVYLKNGKRVRFTSSEWANISNNETVI